MMLNSWIFGFHFKMKLLRFNIGYKECFSPGLLLDVVFKPLSKIDQIFGPIEDRTGFHSRTLILTSFFLKEWVCVCGIVRSFWFRVYLHRIVMKNCFKVFMMCTVYIEYLEELIINVFCCIYREWWIVGGSYSFLVLPLSEFLVLYGLWVNDLTAWFLCHFPLRKNFVWGYFPKREWGKQISVCCKAATAIG